MVAGTRRLRRRRGDRPALGVVPRRQAGPRRPDDAALGALARAAPVGRVHRRQPRLRPARRVPHRRRGRAGRRRAAAALHVRLGARPDPLRARPRRARDVPDRAPVHVPAGLLPPDRARHRPRPRRGLRRRRSGRSSATARRPTGWPPTPTSTSTPCSTRRRAGRAEPCDARPGAAGELAERWRAILLRQPTWRAEAEIRAEYEAGDYPDARSSPVSARPRPVGWPSTWRSSTRGRTIRGQRCPARRSSAGTGPRGSIAEALGSIPAYWLIGRRYRRRAG